MTLSLALPQGWIEKPRAGALRELWAVEDGSTGLLQLSPLPADQLDFVLAHPRLGELAIEIGRRIGWPEQAASQEGPCVLGRFGFAIFRGGEYPAMFLWVTASKDAAYLWTWLGPEPMSAAVKEAVTIVQTATRTARA